MKIEKKYSKNGLFESDKLTRPDTPEVWNKIVMDEPESPLIQNDSGYLFNDYANNLEKAMNMMAKRGWRLISVYSVEAAYFAVFEKIARAALGTSRNQ